MTNIESTEITNEDLNLIVMKAIISVALALNFGFAGALSPSLYAVMIATGLGLAGWIVVEHIPSWLLGLPVLARVSNCKTAGSNATIADIGCTVDFAVPPAISAELLNFAPAESTLEYWNPADFLKLTDADEIFKFALEYNKDAPEIASKHLRYIINKWEVRQETKVIWMNAIEKIESHNDGKAMASLFFGGEPPMVTYTNAQGQPVACWEDRYLR